MRETTFREAKASPIELFHELNEAGVISWADLAAKYGQENVLGAECEREAKAGAELVRLNIQLRELQQDEEHLHQRYEALKQELKVMGEDRDEYQRRWQEASKNRDCWIQTHKVATQNYAKELARMAVLALGKVEL